MQRWHFAVFDTTFGNPDPRLVGGEGYGEDVIQARPVEPPCPERRSFTAHPDKGGGRDGRRRIPLTNDSVLIVELFGLVDNQDIGEC